MTKFPDAFRTELEICGDESPPQVEGHWLTHHRPRLRSRYVDGTSSESYTYEFVTRRAMDAIVVALHHEGTVLLRSALRPPLAFRGDLNVPLKGDLLDDQPTLWELPAGLIEPEETGHEGILACAVRETLEETGFVLDAQNFSPLGAPVFLSPGVNAEQLHYFEAAVGPEERGVPTEDGSPLEARAAIHFVPFAEALAWTHDAKSEVGIHRLIAKLAAQRSTGKTEVLSL